MRNDAFQSNDAFKTWRREREAVEQEMDLLITAGWPASSEERQIRRTRFAALLERRETAARNLLHADRARRTDKSASEPSRPGDLLISAAQAGSATEGEQAAFVPLPDGRTKVDVPAETKADVPAELPAPVTTAVSAFDAVALALDAPAVPPVPAEPDTVSTAGTTADTAELPADDIALAPEASVVLEASIPPDASVPLDASVPSDADAVTAAGPPADVPEPATEEAAPGPDVAAPLPDPTTITAADGLAQPTEAPTEVPTEAISLAPEAATELSGSTEALATDPPAEAAEPSIQSVALVPDAAAHTTEPAVAVASQAPVAAPADAAPPADDAKAPSSPSSDDVRFDALLTRLLRRLKPN